MTAYRDLLPVIIEQEAAVLPGGCDSWAVKSVHPDLRTRGGFRWAYPGGTSRSDHNTDRDNTSACPSEGGDGLCVATTWRGMASGSIPARTLLLVAYRSSDVLGRDDERGKLRVAGPVHVAAIVDGERFVREHGAGADLRKADLAGADLRKADLRKADLRGADLRGADLRGANLAGADLDGADLRGADMEGADLRMANFARSGHSGGLMARADLAGANLTGADLRGADLAGADLDGANLRGANLDRVRGLNLPYGWALTDAGMAVRS